MINTKTALTITGYIAMAVIISMMVYASYRWYFKRPPQVVNQNTYQTYTVMPGANQTVENYKQVEKKRKLGYSCGVWTTQNLKTFGLYGGVTW